MVEEDNHQQAEGRTRHEPVQHCDMTSDGVCGMHNVIEERRSFERNRLNDLKKDFVDHTKLFYDYKKTNNDNVNNLCSFKNKVIGFSLLGVLVLTGAYAYTYTHTISTDIRHSALSSRLDKLEDDVNANKTNVAVLVYQIQTTNARLTEMIQLMRDKNYDKKGEK